MCTNQQTQLWALPWLGMRKCCISTVWVDTVLMVPLPGRFQFTGTANLVIICDALITDHSCSVAEVTLGCTTVESLQLC